MGPRAHHPARAAATRARQRTTLPKQQITTVAAGRDLGVPFGERRASGASAYDRAGAAGPERVGWDAVVVAVVYEAADSLARP